MSRKITSRERLFKSYFEEITDAVKKELESSGSMNVKLTENIAYQIAEKCMWTPLRCLIFEMHELKEKGMLSGNNSEQMYASYSEQYLNDKTYLIWFNEKYPLIKKIINKRIKDTSRFIAEVLNHLKQDKQSIVAEL